MTHACNKPPRVEPTHLRPEQEIEADRVAANVGDGQARGVRPPGLDRSSRDPGTVRGLATPRSFEHRALGDVPPTEIQRLLRATRVRQQTSSAEINLMWLWHQSPERVSEKDFRTYVSAFGLLRLQPEQPPGHLR